MKTKFLNFTFAFVLLLVSICISAKNYHRNEAINDKTEKVETASETNQVIMQYKEPKSINPYKGVRSSPVIRANIYES